MIKGETLFERAAFTITVLFKMLIPPLVSLDRIEKYCRDRLIINPKAYLPRWFLADTYKYYQKNEEAKKEYIELRRLGYMTHAEQYSIGEVCYRLRDYRSAIEEFEPIAGCYSHDGLFNSYIGMSYFYTGAFERALPHLVQAAELPKRRGLLSWLKKGLEPETRQGYLYMNIAYCFFNLGQFEKAAEYYRKALLLERSGPRFQEVIDNAAIAHINVANKLLQENKIDEAVAQFHMALELEPENSIVQAISKTLNDIREQVPSALKTRLH